jgi:hypothetical protein
VGHQCPRSADLSTLAVQRGTSPANGNTAYASASLGGNPMGMLVGFDGALDARA